MGWFSKLAGIIGTSLQIDVVNGGPRHKNNAGTMETRNAADTAYANVRANASLIQNAQFYSGRNFADSGDVPLIGTDGTAANIAQVGDPTRQASLRGGLLLAAAQYAGHATRTGLVTDDLVEITDTSAPATYQAVAMGSTATAHAFLLIRDVTNNANVNPITFMPPAGKNYNNVLNATATISTAGGWLQVYEDASGNWWSVGTTG